MCLTKCDAAVTSNDTQSQAKVGLQLCTQNRVYSFSSFFFENLNDTSLFMLLQLSQFPPSVPPPPASLPPWANITPYCTCKSPLRLGWWKQGRGWYFVCRAEHAWIQEAKQSEQSRILCKISPVASRRINEDSITSMLCSKGRKGLDAI